MGSFRLGIFSNFGPPSIGGSEYVIKNISEILVKYHGYNVTVYSYSCDYPSVEKGVFHLKCRKGKALINQINENDRALVYGDSFWGFDTILKNIDTIKPDVSLALLGADHMKNNSSCAELFKKNINKFNIIAHESSGADDVWASRHGLKVNIIPNGINLSEFRDNGVNFREKYDIKEKYILLNVSNYFLGKGQETLIDIGKKLKEDCVIVQISNTVKYPYDKKFFKRCKDNSKGVNMKFLRDLKREDVVSAFLNSDVFVFTSKKEVAPIVLLESRASMLPWISMDVGNAHNNQGGMIVWKKDVDEKGYAIVDESIVDKYVDYISNIIEDKELRVRLAGYGQEKINDREWKNIVPLYKEVFDG